MKYARSFALVLVFLMLVPALFSCRKEEWGGAYPYELNDYVSLCSYKRIPVLGWVVEVTDEEVEQQVLLTKSQYSGLTEVKDRGAAELDFLVIDYEGTVDGEKVDFLSEEGCQVVLGSGALIAGFEEALYGAYAGDTLTIDLTLPKPYKEMPSYSGKSVTFRVTVKEVDEQSFKPYTDQMIAGVTEYKTTAEFEKAIREILLEEERKVLNQYLTEQVWTYVNENSRILQLPASKVDEKYAEAMDFYQAAAIRTENSFEEYVKELGYESEAAFEAFVKAEVEKSVGEEMLVYAIARREGLLFSEDEYRERVTEYAVSLGVASVEAIELIYGREEIETTLLFDKVKAYLANEARISDYESGKRIRYNVMEDTTFSPMFFVYIGIFLVLGTGLIIAVFSGSKKQQKTKSQPAQKKRRKNGA